MKKYLIIILFIFNISLGDSISISYNNIAPKTAIKQCILSFEKCGFDYYSIDSNKLAVFYPPSNKAFCKVIFSNSDTLSSQIEITSYISMAASKIINERPNKFFGRIIYQIIDQTILGSKSVYCNYKFQAKNENLYTFFCLLSPSVGLYYFLDSPINNENSKILIPSLLLGLDALSILAIVKSDKLFHLDKTNSNNRYYGIAVGTILMAGVRLVCAFSNDQGFKVLRNFESSGMGLSYKIDIKKN